MAQGSPSQTLPQEPNRLRLPAAAILGAVFALALYQAWQLELRWLVATVIGIAGLGLAMCFARVFSDFMLLALMFALPFVSFSKWFWPESLAEDERGNLVYAGAFGVGVIDFILLALYLSWFYRIFVLKSERLPRLNFLDLCVGWFLLANLIATIGSPQPIYGLGVVHFLIKYAMLYFYLSRNLQPRHLRWLLGAFAFAIAIEASLGVYQAATGNLLGIALDKGAGGEEINYQYTVPGTEGTSRATGTCYDSHSLGLFAAMLLPFPLILCVTPRLRLGVTAASAAAAALAALTVYLSLSRSAWVALAIALPIGAVLILTIWREREARRGIVVAFFATLLVAIIAAPYIYDRFANSPYGTLTTRFDQYEVGLQVWMKYPLFGYGPGNWIEALHRFDFLWLEVLPVHNFLLWTATETGLFGVTAFLAIAMTASWRLLRLARRRSDLAARLAMAAFLAILVSLLTGMTDPTLREPNTFAIYWLMIALSVALPAMPPGSGETGLLAERKAC